MIRYLLFAIAGAVLWRLGGSVNKVFRRFALPGVITLSQLKKRPWWAVLGLFGGLVGVFSLGYGEGRSNWQRFAVGCLWVVPRFLILGFSPFAVAVPFVWIALFWLSNHKPYSSIVKWGLVEVVMGGLIGLAYA